MRKSVRLMCEATEAASFNLRAREGRDESSSTRPRPIPSFNPRAREGRDRSPRGLHLGRQVSIHAPVKGATLVVEGSEIEATFQSTRRREGRDQEDGRFRRRAPRFNPRAREGRDRACPCGLRLYTGFNPRAREGRDGRGGSPEECPQVSIHAPVKGATATRERLFRSTLVSIHAPVKGATT